MVDKEILWGIDLGGTKIEAIVLRRNNPFDIIARKRLPTESHHGQDHILNQIKKLVDALKSETGLSPNVIGIGTPGTIDPKLQTLKNSNTVCLNGKPLKAELEDLLQLEVRMANDANCFALAETQFGAIPENCPDASVVFGVIMGTGVGGGLVVNGQIIGGKHGIGGEWGHTILDESVGPCYCGKMGCTELVISGPALQKYYRRNSGKEKNMQEIVAAYRAESDEYATQTMHRLFDMFGKGISNIINVYDPDAIILGGGLGNIDELYTHGVAAIDQFIFNDSCETVFLRPKLGDSAGVFGAALL